MLEKQNYRINQTVELPPDFINGQGVGAVSSMRYGLWPMSWNGCEMIAVYNAAHLLGHHEELADICLELYPQTSIAMGFFGSNVLRLGRYFEKRGIPFEKTFDYNAFFNELPRCRCGILSFWNHRRLFGSLHTVMVRWDAERGQLWEYNKTNGKDVPVPHDARALVTNKKLFIVGYLFS